MYDWYNFLVLYSFLFLQSYNCNIPVDIARASSELLHNSLMGHWIYQWELIYSSWINEKFIFNGRGNLGFQNKNLFYYHFIICIHHQMVRFGIDGTLTTFSFDAVHFRATTRYHTVNKSAWWWREGNRRNVTLIFQYLHWWPCR